MSKIVGLKQGTLLGLICLVIFPVIVNAQRFIAPADVSQWDTIDSPLYCELNHNIPGYGQASFGQAAGKRQTFALSTTLGRLKKGQVSMQIIKTNWMGKQKIHSLGKINIHPGSTPVQLSKMTVYQLLEHLQKGHQAQFNFIPANTSIDTPRSKDKVVLSTVGFQEGYQEYLKCIDNLIPDHFDGLKRSTIFFESNSVALTREAKQKLEVLAKLIRSDETITKIKMEGHSDSRGSYMSKRYMANRRMWMAKDYLVNLGVPPKLFIQLKGYSDRKPIGKNKTKKGRALNRRVEMRLYRH